MKLFRAPRIEAYWDKRRRTPRHEITMNMTLLCFQQLKHFLPVCDPCGENGKSSFFMEIESLFQTLMNTSKKLWKPGKNMVVYEMMVMMYGRWSKTVWVRSKLNLALRYGWYAISDIRFTLFLSCKLSALEKLQRLQRKTFAFFYFGSVSDDRISIGCARAKKIHWCTQCLWITTFHLSIYFCFLETIG